MKRRAIFYILILVGAGACSTTFKVESEPSEAQVVIVSSQGKDRKPLGKTPLEMSATELQEKLGNPEATFFTIEVVKEGFEAQKMTLPTATSGALLSELKILLKKGNDKKEKNLISVESLLNQLFLAQRFAREAEFERALIEIDKILEVHPKFSRALSMKGSIYFAQKKYEESLKWYDMALAENPELPETIKLAAKVRRLSGQSRNPAKRGVR